MACWRIELFGTELSMQIAYTCGSYVCVEASECATSKPSQWQALEVTTAQAGGVLLSIDWSSLHGYIVTGGEDCRCGRFSSPIGLHAVSNRAMRAARGQRVKDGSNGGGLVSMVNNLNDGVSFFG